MFMPISNVINIHIEKVDYSFYLCSCVMSTTFVLFYYFYLQDMLSPLVLTVLSFALKNENLITNFIKL